MGRKDNVETEEAQAPEDAQSIVDASVEPEQTPVQVITESQLINLKLDKIIELLSKK